MTTTIVTTGKENPYVGPRPLEAGDLFYGRLVETYELFDLLVAERIVLLYSPSGAGKTSLLQAGVIPRLKDDGFRVLPPIRISASDFAEAELGSEGNRYVLSVLLRLEQARVREPRRRKRQLEELRAMTLVQYLRRHPVATSKSRHCVLIFDQFEEVLTADPTDLKAKEEFFEQLGEALEDRTYWALFAMREDYLAGLDEYRDFLPTHLEITYRLNLLRGQNALQAIIEPAAAHDVEFSRRAAEKVYDDLRQLHGLHEGDTSGTTKLGEHVEPVQLQVVCRSLWQRRRHPEQIDETDTAELQTNEALGDYYVECLQRVVTETGADERGLRDWFDEKLITREGLRNQTSEGPTGRSRMDRRILTSLVDSYLLRSESVRGGTWYELAHDRLIDPVLQSNDRWRKDTFIPLQHKAREWLEYDRADDFLLRGKAFIDAERWAARHAGQLSDKEQAYLDACRQAWRRERRSSYVRKGMISLTVLLVVAVLVALVAILLARRQAQISESRQLVTIGLRTLSVDPELSILLALEAAERSRESQGHLSEADRDLLYRAVGASRLRATFVRPPPPATAALGRQSGAIPPPASVTRPPESLMDIALDPDGRTIAAAGWDGRVTIWRTDNGGLIRELRPGGRDRGKLVPVTSIAFHAADNSLAVGGQDGTVTIVDAVSGGIRGRVRTASEVVDLTYDQGSGRLAAVSKDGAVSVWNAQRRKLLTLSASPRVASARAVAFSPDGRSLAVGGVGGILKLWDIATRSPRQYFIGHTADVDSVALSPDGRLLGSASLDGSAKVWDAETGRNITTLAGHTGSLLDVAFSPDGARLSTASIDGSAKVWDAATGRELLSLLGHKKAVSATIFDPTGTTLFTSSWDGLVKRWDVASGHSGFVNSVAFDRDGRRLVTASADKTARIWDFASGRELHVLSGHTAEVRQAVFSPDGRLVATASTDRTARIWEARTGRQVHVLPAKTPLNAVAFSPGFGGLVATAGSDGSVVLWDTSTGRRVLALPSHPGGVNGVAFDPGGFRVATAGVDGVTIWEIASGRAVRKIPDHTGAVLRVSYSDDGRFLATAGEGGTAALWDAHSGRLLRTFRGHASAVSDVVFCKDCERLATASWDRTVRVWDLTEQRSTPELTIVQPAQINSVAFSPDDRYLATAGADKTINEFPLDDDDLVQLAESRVTRSLTPEECETYLHETCPSGD